MLTIENLSVDYYRRGQGISAVRDFSLAIGPGQIVGLVGESGSGKSTVALAVLRLIRATEGKITKGRILFDPSPRPSPEKGEGDKDGPSPSSGEGGRRPGEGGAVDLLTLPEQCMRAIRGKRISMIFQDPFTALNPVMTIREQMEEVLAAHPLSSSPAASGRGSMGPPPTTAGDDELSAALARVQLDPTRILASYPHQLSGGQRQRVLIATALLTRPDLVLADEPTTALDVLVQKEILDLLFQLQKEMGLCMLLISHNLGLVAQYAGRMAVMKEGQIVEEGDARQIFQSPKHAYTRELLSALPPMVRRPV